MGHSWGTLRQQITIKCPWLLPSSNQSLATIAAFLGSKGDVIFQGLNARFRLRVQWVVAIQALNLSAGFSYAKVFLSRSINRLAMAFSLACE